jgi:hypothetical protein
MLNWRDLTRDQAAALQEITVDEYLEGRGEGARQVRRVKFKLASKQAALEKIGAELGMFVQRADNKHHVQKRFSDLPESEREAAAADLIARARAALERYRHRTIEGQANEVVEIEQGSPPTSRWS